MSTFHPSTKEYITVLEIEAETLRRNYFNRSKEGTGHYNTAISVLEERIATLKNKLEETVIVSNN
jgi:hypothetical protein